MKSGCFYNALKIFMKNSDRLHILKNCPLFNGIGESDLAALLGCLTAAQKSCAKDDFIFLVGERAGPMGVVLTGSLHIVREDFWGRRTILTHIGPGELFGEAFAFAGLERLPVSAMAAEASEVLLLDRRKIMSPCQEACAFHASLVGNMLRILARKNVILVQKIEHLTRRSTREKLLAYLSSRARETGSDKFSIPFNRQELADYLAVDRSAMSNELSKMREEGILEFNHNEFELFRLED